jgi:hypothetical protein
MSLDEALTLAYGEKRVPADKLLLDGLLGEQFFELVRLKATEPIERGATLRRLLTLRKMGRLPRLQRSK